MTWEEKCLQKGTIPAFLTRCGEEIPLFVRWRLVPTTSVSGPYRQYEIQTGETDRTVEPELPFAMKPIARVTRMVWIDVAAAEAWAAGSES